MNVQIGDLHFIISLLAKLVFLRLQVSCSEINNKHSWFTLWLTPIYFHRHFLINPTYIHIHFLLFSVQIMILFVSHSSPNSGFKLLTGLVFLQYPTRYYRCKSLLNGDSESGMPVKNASIIFCRNLIICILAGHVVGSWWYLLGIEVGGSFEVSSDAILTLLYLIKTLAILLLLK